MQVMAIIPARSGSKGVPHKNIRILAGYPLLAWSIAAAKLSKRIDRVLVSTDSEEYAHIARRYGAEVPFLRPAEFSSDTSLDIDVLLHTLDWLKEHECYSPDFLVHLRPTTPIRDPQVLDQAIELIAARPEATSVISVYAVDYPPYKYLKMNQNGYLASYMDVTNINIPRQDCPEAFRTNGYVDVLRTDSVWSSKSQLGLKILPLTTSDPGEIDTEEDFRAVEADLCASGNALKQYFSESSNENDIIRKHGKAVAMEQLGRTIAWRKETAANMQKTAAACTVVGQRLQCPICACGDLEAYVSIYGCTYSQCFACGHLFQRDVMRVEDIQALYDNNSDYLSFYASEEFFQKRLEMVARPKATYITDVVRPNAGDEWLDVGCGACHMLYAARELGWRVRGVEAGAIGVAQGLKYGISVAQCYITPENIHTMLTTKPRLLSLFDILEHLPEPQSTLTAMGQALCSHTTVVINIPRHPSLSAFASLCFPELATRHLIIPDHIHIFSEESAMRLLANAGLKTTHIWTYGQDFYEIMSMMTMAAGKEIDLWPSQLMSAANDVQKAIDQHGLSDTMLIVAEKS